MDKFAQFQNFIEVAKASSISKAAERLGIAKSAVSRRLSELEQRLGVQLFHRTTRKIHLTDSGQRLYARVSELLNALNEIEESLGQEQQNLSGLIRVAAPLSFGLQHLAPAILEFNQNHTQITFDIDFNDRQVDLIHEGFDLALRIGVLADSTLIARRLAKINTVLCASPDYLKKHGTPTHPSELNQHQCLLYTLLDAPNQWTFQDSFGRVFNIKINAKLKANNGCFLNQAAIAGAGIIHQPLFIAHKAIESGLLTPILADYCHSDMYLWALYPSTRHVSQRVRAFIDFLVQLFKEKPYWDLCLKQP